MSRYVPVEGYPDLVRDMESGAILNTNRSAIQQARERKRIRQEKKLQENKDRERLESLEKDISEIKEALNLLLQKTHK
jgi:N-glycosylase/DNA lyase